jgi:hypothetical protein
MHDSGSKTVNQGQDYKVALPLPREHSGSSVMFVTEEEGFFECPEIYDLLLP